MSILISLLAKICALCPLCRYKRSHPNARFSQLYRRIERFCPFCRAYNRQLKSGGKTHNNNSPRG